MALPINIEDLLEHKTVEISRIDYKAGWDPEPIINTICAFANDIANIGGGYIVIGIDEENGMPAFPIKGIDRDSIDTINKDLLQKCNLIEPRYIPVISHEIYDGKDILILWVPGGNARPYKCPIEIYQKAKSSKAYYIRKGSNTIKANTEEEWQLFSISASIPFDDRPNPQANTKDIAPYLITDFLNKVGSSLSIDPKMDISDVMLQMGLLDGPAEMRFPKNVALMFFSEDPERFFPYARIEFVDKPDPAGENMTETTFTGPLDQQIITALRFIKGYVIKERIQKLEYTAEAVRTFNYPFPAIEEALVNAVYHKSYEIREPITIALTPEQIEIRSFPGPDRYITDDDLENGNLIGLQYRNRRIGDYLKELKLAEGRNTGIPKIIDSMSKNGSPAPLFITDSERIHFGVILPIHESFLPKEDKKDKGPTRRSKSEMKKAILSILADYGKMSVDQLADALRLSYADILSQSRNQRTCRRTKNRIYGEKSQGTKPESKAEGELNMGHAASIV